MTKLCQFLGGGWKVIIDVKQHSQPLLRVRNRGGELNLSKKDTTAEVERSKKRQKSGFLKNSKIPDCGPTSAARKLKKEENVRT